MKRIAAVLGTATVFAAAYALVLRPWHLRWGATPTEVGATLPGDDLLPVADLVSTRAITISASADDVWPWLAQMGQGRGGFYSYDVLENAIARCDIHSADRVVDEWQDIHAGDAVHLHPELALSVAVVEPGRALVLHGGVPATGAKGTADPPFDFTWTFVVDDLPGGSRLIMRERYAYTRRWAAAIVEPVEAASFVMSQRMLRGIRDRAER